MGLDVRVYQNIKLSDENDYDFQVYVIDKEFNDRIKNLVDRGYYKGNIVFSNISYPYSAHSTFRNKLGLMIGLNDREWINEEIMTSEKPFFELIMFADNEGSIDFESAKNLYEDFVFYEEKAKLLYYDDQNFLDKYEDWKQACFYAKDNGVIYFT